MMLPRAEAVAVVVFRSFCIPVLWLWYKYGITKYYYSFAVASPEFFDPLTDGE